MLKCPILPIKQPGSMNINSPKTIVDKDNKTYTLNVLDDDSSIVIKVYRFNTLIGEVKCFKESLEVLYLRDIAIANDAIPDLRNIWVTPQKKILQEQPGPVNYRGRGLGSALMTFLIRYAAGYGFQAIYGNVYQQDLENNPKLLQWYQRHGFQLRPVAPDAEPDIVSVVHLTITSIPDL